MATPKLEGWQKRNNLSICGFIGLGLMYALRFNLSIGIVAMVNESASHQHITNYTGSTEELMCPSVDPNRMSTNSSNVTLPDEEDDIIHNGGNPVLFDWNEKDQGLVLGSFFWGYILTQLPGGMLARQIGAKWVVGLGLLSTGLLALILPWAATVGGLPLVLVIRVLQGLGEGVMLPAFLVLLAKWTAPEERASLTTSCLSGMPFGTALTMVASGYLISTFGWPAVFYVPGALTILWFVAWSLLVYSSPKDHPTISEAERKYIENANKDSPEEEDVSIFDVPWKEMFFSVPLWAIMISHFANTWSHNVLKVEGPKFLRSAMHFNIHENAYIAATPYICQLVICNIVVRTADYLIARKLLSVHAARRLCNTIGQGGTAISFLGLILAGCNPPIAILFYILSGSMNGAVYGGFFVNPIDIAPNYAGVIEGIVNCLGNLSGFLGPYTVGLILHSEYSITGWHYVFLVPVIGDTLGNLIFVMYSSVKVQPWNNKGGKVKETISL